MSMSTPIAFRESKYCDGIRQSVEKLGHATNVMILEEMRKSFPNISATTVHRATARLAARGELLAAPADTHGAMRYEAVKPAHDHFMCVVCGRVQDIDIVDEIVEIIQGKLDNCYPSGRVVISGTCGYCHR